ncbi:hypothetical protein H2200_003867 [Cladophialophora chaetospira]|uniref:F-box domain-containing protein n=1 Tax=Cladophialophora chaetospira TaxID=386627 RepID=A0AA38XF09_9EURO|nr:hypothetical protein H2200_003867 [Cladophialophora chaetospira]
MANSSSENQDQVTSWLKTCSAVEHAGDYSNEETRDCEPRSKKPRTSADTTSGNIDTETSIQPVSSHFPFTTLAPEIQSRVVDFLDFLSLERLRFTCQKLRALPTHGQQYAAFLEFESTRETCWESAHLKTGYVRSRRTKELCEATGWHTQLGMQLRDVGDSAMGWGLREAQVNSCTWAAYLLDLGGCAPVAELTVLFSPGLFSCHNCLRLKHWKHFDADQFKREPWHTLNWNLPKWGEMMPETTNQRLCFECRHNSTDARRDGLGWLYSHQLDKRYCFRGSWTEFRTRDFHIRCSRCLTVDHVEGCKIYRSEGAVWHDDYDNRRKVVSSKSNGDGRVVKDDDEVVCRRMLKGTLCRSCYQERNARWNAYKSRLGAEVRAKKKYLDWMEQRDQSRWEARMPNHEVVEVCETTKEGAPTFREPAPQWRNPDWHASELDDGDEDTMSQSDWDPERDPWDWSRFPSPVSASEADFS